ncbi:MAG: cysteine hydrolase [bacterium]|nr:cysteine hydrolase [bacterium]
MDINEQKTAILLIEFQNQWTQKGLYHRLIKGQLEKRGVLENTKNLVDRARERGIKIIHAPLVIDSKNKRGWLAFLTFGKVFTKGTWKSEISEGLFREGDLLVKGRYAFDAFIGSDLENILRENGIEIVFVCGFTTDQCVAKTMDTMTKKEFNAYLVSDCTATLNSFFQKRTEKKFADRVVNSNNLLIQNV